MLGAFSPFTARRRVGGTAAALSAAITSVTGTTVTGTTTAPAGTTVFVLKGGAVLGTATANGAGGWTYTLATAAAPGDVYTAAPGVPSAAFTVPGTPASSTFRFDSTSARFDATTLTFDKAA